MKRYITSLLILAAAVVIHACKRELPTHAGYTGTGGMAFIKIVDASPNWRKIFSQPDSLDIFIGGNKVNNTMLKFGTSFPAYNTSNIGYAAVKPGQQAITINSNTNGTENTVVTLQKNLVAGSYYTLIITDSIQSTRDSSQIWLNDYFGGVVAGTGYTNIRLVSAVWDDSANATFNLYSPRRNQTFFSKVPKGAISAFVSIPTILSSLDTLYMIKSNTGAIVAKFIPTIPFGDQEFYTIYNIGDTTVSLGKRQLVVFQNK